MADIIQLRRDTAANWVTANPVLHDGEIGIETDTRKRKCGDGTTAWNSLPYMFSDDLDQEPTANSRKSVESGGVKAAIDVAILNNGKGAFDISAYKSVDGVLAKFDDLAQALGTNGANVPEAARNPGMSVCFVLNSDNKYVQFRLISNVWSTIVADWQSVDKAFTDINDLQEINNGIVGKTENLISLKGKDWKVGTSDYCDFSINNNEITITSKRDTAYNYIYQMLDVRYIDKIIFYCNYNGTGQAEVRFGKSSDKSTWAWITNSHLMPVTIDTSDVEYLVVALYVAYDTKQPVGANVTYSELYLIEGEVISTAAVPQSTSVDYMARRELQGISLLPNSLGLETINEVFNTKYNYLYSADTKVLPVVTKRFQYIQYILSHPIDGKFLIVEGKRDKGKDEILRIRDYKKTGERTDTLFTKLPCFYKIENSDNLELSFNACLATQIDSSESPVTFSDIKVYYVDDVAITSFIENGADNIIGSNYNLSGEHIFNAEKVTFNPNANKSYVGFNARFVVKPNSFIRVKGSRNKGNDFLYRVRQFDANNVYVEHKSSFENDVFYIRENTEYIEIVWALAWGTALSSLDDVYLTNVGVEYVNNSENTNSGNVMYKGAKLSFKQEPETPRCYRYKVWKHFDGSLNAQYDMHNNQSIEIWGDYVFLFNAFCTFNVIRYSTKELIGHFQMPDLPEKFHANSAQFAKGKYYAEGDEFPLLLLSRCDGAGKSQCYVMRITRSGNAFSCTTINIIEGLGSEYWDWAYDEHNNTLYGFTSNGSSSCDLYGWNNVNLTSDSEVNISSAHHHSVFDYAVFQGMTMHNGNVYIGVEEQGGSFKPVIWVIDAFSGELTAKIPLPLYDPDTYTYISNREMEGICIFNGSMYISRREDSITAETPLEIIKIDVD